MKSIKAKTLAETIIAAAICSLLAIIAVYVPFLSIICSVLCGIPLMYVAYRHSLTYGGISTAFATLCIGCLTADFVSAALIMLSYGLPAMLFGFCSNKGLRFSVAFTLSSVLVILGNLVQLMIINGSGDGIELMFTQAAQSMTDMIAAMLPSELIPANVSIETVMAETVAQTVNSIIYYMPAIMIIMSVVAAYVVIMLGIFILNRIKGIKIEYLRFNMIKMPKITVVMIIAMFLLTDLFDADNIYVAALCNIMVISIAAVGISGFSYIDYRLSQKIKSGYIRAIIYIGIWTTGFMFVPIIAELSFILGVFDIFSKKRMPKVGGDERIENKQK